jgi:hypothetical protein
LTPEKTREFEDACQKLLEEEHVRFVGIVNPLGNLIAGGFKKGIIPLLDSQNLKMVFMQMQLDFNMRQDFDKFLGPIDYIASRRKNQLIISVPIGENLVLITAEPDSDDKKIIKQAEHLFDEIHIETV